MAVVLGTLGFFVTEGATQGGGLVPGSPKSLRRGLGRGVRVVLHQTLAL